MARVKIYIQRPSWTSTYHSTLYQRRELVHLISRGPLQQAREVREIPTAISTDLATSYPCDGAKRMAQKRGMRTFISWTDARMISLLRVLHFKGAGLIQVATPWYPLRLPKVREYCDSPSFISCLPIRKSASPYVEQSGDNRRRGAMEK